MHRRPSVLSYRPKTSSAAEDDDRLNTTASAPVPREHTMKRTASQTFTNTHYLDVKDSGMALDAVTEGDLHRDCGASQHSHSSSLSRAFGVMTGQFTRQKTRRRLSSFSSTTTTTAPRRRGSIQSFMDALPSPLPSSQQRKNSTEQPRTHLPTLPHTDSGMQPFHLQPGGSKPFSFKRFSSMRRRPTTSGPSDNAAPHNFATPYPHYPSQAVPGAAARQAAAAANQDRQNQIRREQESQDHTHRFLNGLIPSNSLRDDDLKDNESGVDMTCASDIVRADSVTEKKMSMCHPLYHHREITKLTCASRPLRAPACRASYCHTMQPRRIIPR
jgi:F-box and WD-40 domain protein 1/11